MKRKTHSGDTDYFTASGAELLRTQIVEYWERRGFFGIEVARICVGDSFVIRSNMVNGVPPVAGARPSEARVA